MRISLSISEKIVSITLLFVGILFTIQAIEGYITSYIVFHDGPDSYRISVATYVSNLINGNLLIVSSLLFLKKKSLGALFFQYTGIMFVFYAINCVLFDFIIYDYFDWETIIISVFFLLPFGVFLFFYFKKKNLIYRNRSIIPLFTILGILIYLYLNLFFCDWFYFMER